MPKFKDKEEYEKWKTERLNKTQENPTIMIPEETKSDPLPQKPEQTYQDSQLCFSKKALSDFVNNFLNTAYPKRSKWGVPYLFYGEFITSKILTIAHSYAHYDLDNEKILLVFDDLMRPTKSGFVMTDSNFYYIADGNKGKIPLEKIKTIKTVRYLGGLLGFSIMINEQSLRFVASFPVRTKELDILQGLFIQMNLDIFKIDLDKLTNDQEEVSNKIKGNMLEGEKIIFYAWDITDRFFEVDSGICYTCTNYRLIICYFNSGGVSRINNIPYDHITSVAIYGDSIFSLLSACKIRIAAAQSVSILTGLRCSDAEQIEKIVMQGQKNKIGNSTEGQFSSSDKINDMSQEIMKLKNLLDCGALTKEEFDEAKKNLLEQL